MKQDLEHLKLLSIFHYVAAGMAAMLACIPFLHFFMGLALATGAFPDTDADARPIGLAIMAFAGLFSLHPPRMDLCRLRGLRWTEPPDEEALHLLSGDGRYRVHFHAGRDRPWSLYDHRPGSGLGEKAIRTADRFVLIQYRK
jgi:hypothetical protein